MTITDNETGEIVEQWGTWGFNVSNRKLPSDLYPHVIVVFPVHEEVINESGEEVHGN